MSEFDLFATCAPGLEPWLEAELRDLHVADIEVQRGGVAFRGGWPALRRANLECGLASQILVRVTEFGARSLQDLDIRGARTDWTAWLPPGTPTEVRAHCRRSRIYHSGAAEQRIARHLREQLGEADTTAEPVRIRARIADNRCTLSLDTSGEPLHRRGWRLDPGRAPLREDLARALVLASGWDCTSPLVDPFAGSGTIAIEAAILARGLAPGRLRRFAFERFVDHDAEALAMLREQARDGARPRILASDRSAEAVAVCRANAVRAGVAEDLEIREATLTDSFAAIGARPERGALVTNPPYGVRLDAQRSLSGLYHALGDVARDLPGGWTVTLAAADRRLALKTGLPLTTVFLVESGGLRIRALTNAARATGTAPPSSTP